MTTEDIKPMIPKVIIKIRKKPKTVPLQELYEALSEDLDDCFWGEVVEELFDRKLFENKVIELIRGSIADYDPSKQNEKQLGDDYRIVLGWYSSIKSGRTLFKTTDSGKQPITIDDCKHLALSIFKEMISKGFKFNHESTYKKHSSELFRWLISQVGRDKVPFKKETLRLDIWPGTYDPHPKFEGALKKDWKLFFSYFSRIQKGEKLFVIPTPDFEPTEDNPGKEITEAEVKSRALALFKELIARKKTFSRNKYKGNYKILFDWLVEQVGPQKVPWTGGGKSIKSLPFNPNHITKAELPNIDPLNCKIMSDTELILVDRQLHRMVTPQEGSNPEIDRAHGYVLAEIKHRGLPHEPGPNAAELAIDPASIKREDLEQIDSQFIKSLTNAQLETLHSRLHEIFKEYCKGKEV